MIFAPDAISNIRRFPWIPFSPFLPQCSKIQDSWPDADRCRLAGVNYVGEAEIPVAFVGQLAAADTRHCNMRAVAPVPMLFENLALAGGRASPWLPRQAVPVDIISKKHEHISGKTSLYYRPKIGKSQFCSIVVATA